jgi:hypothetical protein
MAGQMAALKDNFENEISFIHFLQPKRNEIFKNKGYVGICFVSL